MSNGVLTLERFHRLVEETGLGPFIDSYRARGYDFMCQTAASPANCSMAQIKEKRIWLSGKDLDTLDGPRAPEAVRFLAILLHEIGHIEASERGLKQDDERIAWDIAAQISPVPLPAEWNALRAYGLTTYGLREIGDVVSEEDGNSLQDFKCPACHTETLAGCPKLNHLSNDRRMFYEVLLCRSCNRGVARAFALQVPGSSPVFKSFVHWNVPQE